MAAQRPTIGEMAQVIRYYQAGLVNMAFGFACYAAFVRLGMNAYLAQLCSHMIGTAFNYITYSRHVFRDSEPAYLRFILSYVLNYFIGLALLFLVRLFISSPYISGFCAVLLTSAFNYFILKKLVFATSPR